MIEVAQTCRARAGSCQRVGLRPRKGAGEGLTVCSGHSPVTGGTLAILCRCQPVSSGQRAVLGNGFVLLARELVRVHRPVSSGGGLVPHPGREIASLGHRFIVARNRQPGDGGLFGVCLLAGGGCGLVLAHALRAGEALLLSLGHSTHQIVGVIA